MLGTRKLSLLFADDEEYLLDIFKNIFEPYEGIQVITAKDGLDAINKIKNQKFDLIYLDFKMPKLNGLQVAEEIQKGSQNKNTPLMVVSGYMPKGVEQLFKKSNHDIRFIAKPFRKEDILLSFKEELKGQKKK